MTFTDIIGATDSLFRPRAADLTHELRVVASYTDGFGTHETVTSAATDSVRGPPRGLVPTARSTVRATVTLDAQPDSNLLGLAPDRDDPSTIVDPNGMTTVFRFKRFLLPVASSRSTASPGPTLSIATHGFLLTPPPSSCRLTWHQAGLELARW